MRQITSEHICSFKKYLLSEEKSPATIEKYLRDVNAFVSWTTEPEVTKDVVIKYKSYLSENYLPSSVNSMLSSLMSFFSYLGWSELKVKALKIQHSFFESSEIELSNNEYKKLLLAAKSKKDERLYLLLQTICSTGIRVSELKYITVSSVNNGTAMINCKGKRRKILLTDKLCSRLRQYIKKHQIKKGPIFVTKNGNPIDRSNIWTAMKKLALIAGVSAKKAFPHNLRHLFARTFYTIQKDVVRLADILGHSNINTTRIYTAENEIKQKKHLQRLGLLLC